MVKEAEAHAAEDKKRRQEIDVRNQADALVYQTEKTLNENREKIPVNEVNAIEGSLKEAKEAIESGDMNRIREKMELLTKASHHLAEIMYQQASGKQQAPGADAGAHGGPRAGKPKPEEDVVDAEFEEKK
jgi:molecular chaperone DnaK